MTCSLPLPNGYFLLFVALMKLLSCFPSTKKVREKAEYLIVHLPSNFWPVTNIRKTWTEEFVLLLNSWNLNLKSRRVHLPCSDKKACISPPGGEMKNEEAELSLSHRKQKEVTEKAKGKKKQQSDLKGKGEHINAEAWKKCVSCPVKEKQKLTAPGISQAVSHPSTKPGPTLLSFRDQTRLGKVLFFLFLHDLHASLQYLVFPGGLPSKTIQAQPCLASEIWWDRAVLRVVWP